MTVPPPIPAHGHSDERGSLRVFALQYRIDLDHSTSIAAYRCAMRELMDRDVVPNMVPGRPTLVVFPEAVGLLALAAGSPGEALRALRPHVATPGPDGIPHTLLAGLAALGEAYGGQAMACLDRLGPVDPRALLFVAATDTLVRGFMATFSRIALDYGVYVVAGSYQADYTLSTAADDVAAFAGPHRPDGDPVYVPTDAAVHNSTFLWGPEVVDPLAGGYRENLLFRNDKVPLTDMEIEMLGLTPGPATGPAALDNAGCALVAGFRVGFATSLPAFAYGYPMPAEPPGGRPDGATLDATESFAVLQDSQGVDVMVQADANPGPWGAPVANGSWQPLEWMGSTWRAVADPSVRFRYNVTPMMTGNLLDLPFDGQSTITGRALRGVGGHFVGCAEAGPDDLPEYSAYAGDKHEFLAMAPWVVPDGPREDLMGAMAALLPGSGHASEGAYVATALFADLLPAEPRPDAPPPCRGMAAPIVPDGGRAPFPAGEETPR